jgi:phosphatidylinositol glycan class S
MHTESNHKVPFLQRVVRDNEVAYVVSEDDLSISITMESQLASHTSSAPTIQFLAYIPPRAQTPMYISNTESETISELNAFLVHRWGGVVIHNSNNVRKIKTFYHLIL